MSNRNTSIVRLSCLSLFISLLCVTPCFASHISALAYINLIDGPYQMTSDDPGTSVMASAASDGSYASAFANTDLLFRTFASASEMGLSIPVSGSIGFRSAFTIQGNPNGVQLPLSFNFDFEGSVNAHTDIDPASIAIARIVSDVRTVSSRTNTDITLTVQGGIPRLLATGDRTLRDVRVRIEPTIAVGLQPPIKLSPEILRELAPNITLFEISFSAFEGTAWEGIAYEIASAIFNRGIKKLNLLPGTDVKIGFDTTFFFDTTMSVSGSFLSNDVIVVFLESQAVSNRGAFAQSDFSNTFFLRSITLPPGFDDVDIESLRVNFDSGLSMPVTRTMSVAEPSGLLLLGSGCISVIVCRRLIGSKGRRI